MTTNNGRFVWHEYSITSSGLPVGSSSPADHHRSPKNHVLPRPFVRKYGGEDNAYVEITRESIRCNLAQALRLSRGGPEAGISGAGDGTRAGDPERSRSLSGHEAAGFL